MNEVVVLDVGILKGHKQLEGLDHSRNLGRWRTLLGVVWTDIEEGLVAIDNRYHYHLSYVWRITTLDKEVLIG